MVVLRLRSCSAATIACAISQYPALLRPRRQPEAAGSHRTHHLATTYRVARAARHNYNCCSILFQYARQCSMNSSDSSFSCWTLTADFVGDFAEMLTTTRDPSARPHRQ